MPNSTHNAEFVEELLAIYDHLPDCRFHINSSGQIQGFHEGTEGNPFGSAESLVGRGLLEVLPLGSEDDLRKLISQALEGRTLIVECRLPKPHGGFAFETRFFRYDDHKLLVMVRDITEKTFAEETLEAVQPSATDLAGDAFFMSLVHKMTTLLKMDYAFVGELAEGGEKIRTLARSQKGEPIAACEFLLPGTPCTSVYGNRFQSYHGNLLEQFPDDETLKSGRFQSFVGAPVFSSEGKPLGILCAMAEDDPPAWVEPEKLLTPLAATCGREIERLHAVKALQHQQAALAHAGRVATVGELSSGVVHEISQPLYAVANFSAACRRTLEGVEFEGSADVAGYLDRINQASTSAQEIVNRFRNFLQRQDHQRSAVVLNELVEEVQELLAFEIRNHRVTVDYDLALETTVFGNPVQLQQVLVNLILNACEALDTVPPESRRILIRTSVVDNEVEITVEDNGAGISEEAKEHLFEPFFTTKAEGLGIGMAVTKGIISQHGGNIWFTSPLHKGTTFHFTLPVFQDQ